MSERDMEDLIALVERHLGVAWSDIVDWLRENNSLEDIIARFEAHDMDGLLADVDTAAAHFATAVHDGYTHAGQQAAAWLDGKVDTLVRFDVTNDRAVRWAKDNAADKIRQVVQDQRDMVRSVVSDGIRDGDNPRVIARDVRDSIGLTDQGSSAVQSYRDALESQDYANALGRQLSHGHSDRTIAVAQRRGIAMDAGDIDTAVDRYRQNLITGRAETIARTEALRSVHAGTSELFQQAIDRGDVEADSLVRQWHAAHDSRTRSSHRAMDGQRRGVGETFTTGDGNELEYPGDPNGEAEDVINCRCSVSTRIA